MKRTIYILSVSIMLISMTACGAKNVPKTNDTHSFSETQNTEAQITKEEPNETSMIETEDTSASIAANESTTLPTDESDNTYSLVASGCYPYNNGMDTPEEVVEAYLDAFINFDAEALYALLNLDETAVSCACYEQLAGFPSDMLSSPYVLQAGIYYTMMMGDISDDEWLTRVNNPTKLYSYKGEDADFLDYYESWLEEANLDHPFIEKVYCYDSVEVEDADGFFCEFIDDDIQVICIDGKYYLPFFETILGGMEDSGYWIYADVISDAYEKEQLDFEANAYPANAGMDSPEEVVNAYINAAKSDNLEDIYALFNTSECKWAAEVYDKMCIEEYDMNFPIKLTKTDWLILTAKSDMLEYYGQTESVEFEERMNEDNFFEELAEYYNVPMPFTPQEVKEYEIETDSMGDYLYIYSFDDKWYLSVMGTL